MTETLTLDKIEKFPMISWKVNLLCNFSCIGCFSGNTNTESKLCGNFTPKEIAHAFENTRTSWQIHMSGGEPFLYPQFVELCTLLSKNNFLAINTNLSTSNVKRFSEEVNPRNIIFINAAVHIEEREKQKNGIDKFIENYHFLKKNNFKLGCSYVLYPTLFNRVQNDLEYFRSKGLMVNIKIFRGNFDGKEYPLSFTDSEQKIIKSLGFWEMEKDLIGNKISFKDKYCNYGHRDFTMDIGGEVRRCSTSSIKYGNLFKGTFSPDKSPKPCTLKKCMCPQQGLRGTNQLDFKTSQIDWIRQFLREKTHAAINFIPHHYNNYKNR